MKRLMSLFLVAFFLLFSDGVSAYAAEKEVFPYVMTSSNTEILPSGDYIVTEVFKQEILDGAVAAPQAVTISTDGYKVSTYYSSNGTAIWYVQVHGYFKYVSGVSAYATSSSALVHLYSPYATFVSKNAYILGATANAYGCVQYSGYTTDITVSLTCDKYGNLS